MSGEKFTKGEWCIRTSKQMEAKRIVHYVNGGEMPLSEGFANANLIACAPEMYKFLESLSDCDELQMHKQEIKKLLSKARGEL